MKKLTDVLLEMFTTPVKPSFPCQNFFFNFSFLMNLMKIFCSVSCKQYFDAADLKKRNLREKKSTEINYHKLVSELRNRYQISNRYQIYVNYLWSQRPI